MPTKFNLFLLIIFLFTSCSKPKPETESINATEDEAAIKAVLTDMWDALEKHELDRYALHVHPDFTQFGENDSTLLVGKKKEVAGIKNWMERSSNVHTEMIDPRITIKGSVAWIVYYWADAGLSRGAPFSSQGKSTRIFVKENNKWLCIHGHYTSLP